MLLWGEASFPVTLIRSPRPSIAPVDPPMPIIISTRRAPELSATSSEVIICIIVDFQLPIVDFRRHSTQSLFASRFAAINRQSQIGNWQLAMFLLRRLLHNFNHAPTLLCRQRSRFDDAHAIADRRSELIMSHKLRSAAHVPAILRMAHLSIDPHDYSLLHLVRRYGADFLHAITATTLGHRAF